VSISLKEPVEDRALAAGGALDEHHRRCPLCRGALDLRADGHRCLACGRAFPRTTDGQNDFRLAPDESVRLELEYRPRRYDRPIDLAARRERACAERRNSFSGPVPWHLTRDQISYIPEARPGEIALDLGCGGGIHRPVLRALGYRYHGVDYQGDAATDLVDAHTLPFADGVFDLVMAIALLEHIAQPFAVLREAQRVLRPGRRLIGTVAFLEPFHDNSFFHFSPLGVSNTLETCGFIVEDVLAIHGWNVVRAQLEMGFERAPLPRSVPNLLSRPFVALLETYGLIGRLFARDKSRHARDTIHARHAGAFFYVARKP